MKEDTFSIEVFLIINDNKVDVFEFKVLKRIHLVFSTFRESLLAINQLSLLLSSSFPFLYKVLKFLPEISMLVSSTKAKLQLYFRHLGKSFTYIMKRRIVFSDESRIQQFAQKKQTVHRPVGTLFNDCYTQTTVKHPPSVMIWGLCSVMAQLVISFYPSKRRQVPQNVGRQAQNSRGYS